MINVVYIKNPFDLSSREERRLNFTPETSVRNYIKQIALFDEDTISVSINGEVIKDLDTIVNHGDFIVFCPKVEDDILGFLASLALAWVAFGVGGWAATGQWGAAVSTWGSGAIYGYLAAAAVMMIGGQLLNGLFATSPGEWESSQTYSWSPTGNLVQQGAPVPVTYGKVRVAGQIISQHISSASDNQDKQYLNLLLCGGEGEIDSISDIEINDTPVSYYNDIKYETRLGKNDQTYISNFGDTYADLALNYELKENIKARAVSKAYAVGALVYGYDGEIFRCKVAGTSSASSSITWNYGTVGATTSDGTVTWEYTGNSVWSTHQTEGDAGKGLELTFECPQGLFYANNDGGLNEVTVTVQGQYKKVGDSTWTNIVMGSTATWSNSYLKQYNLSYFNNVAGINETWTFTGLEHITVGGGGEGGDIYLYTKYSVVGSISGRKADMIPGQDYNNGLISIKTSSEISYASFFVILAATTNLNITGNVNTAVRRTIRVDNLPAGKYDVRTRCIFKTGTSSRYGTRVFWTQLSHIMYDDFTYPNKVLLGIKALATSQLSGSRPNISWIQERKYVLVWVPNYINGVEQPTGAYVYKSATNPSWICYDMLHKARRIRNINTASSYEYEVRGIPKERFIYKEFERWATYCDTEQLTANIYFDVTDGVWEQLVHIETLGRGKVVFRGTRLGTICDSASSPVQLFTVGNIYSDSFSEDFLSLTSRANAVEITFSNKDNNYKQEIVTVYNSGFDTSNRLVNVSQVSLYGCTSRSDAIRYGKYMLRVSDNLIRTVSIEADVDAIACQVGDVISIQHDVPQWGTGGRILSYADSGRVNYTKKVTLDKEVTFEYGKSYKLLSRLIHPTNGEVMESIDVLNLSSANYSSIYPWGASNETVTTNVIYVKPFSIAPQTYEIFSFGESGKITKDFRVLDITRSKEMKRKITALEYIPEVYDDGTTINVSTTINSKTVTTASTAGIKVNDIITGNGSIPAGATVASITNATTLQLSVDAIATYTNIPTTFTPPIPDIGSYIDFPETLAPLNVKAEPTFVVQPNGTILSGLNISWTIPRNTNPSSFMIYTSTNGGTTWKYADRGYGTSHTIFNLSLGTYSIGVTAMYNEGYSSQKTVVSNIQLTERQIPPSDVRDFNATIVNSSIIFTWGAVDNPDLLEYHIRKGTSWINSELIAKVPKGTTTYTYNVSNEGSIDFFIKAKDTSGNFSINEDYINFIVGDSIYPENVTNFDVEQLI